MAQRTCLVMLLAASSLWAQPAYEAATVKASVAGNNNSSSRGSTGQIVMSNLSLKRLIERAYDVKPFQVTGPGWMEDVHFDISAKYPPDTKNEDRAPMLRALLAERFGLVVHRETKDLPGYALVIAKKGIKLKPGEAGGQSDNSTSGGTVWTYKGTNVGMREVADVIAHHLDEMVVDETGLKGVYTFELKWSKDDTDTSVPSLFTALQDSLGLKLQAQKVPAEMIVVDRVERVPIEN